jgi:PAS domain S-box-containing protein
MATKPTYEELDQRLKELEKEAAKCKSAEEALGTSTERLTNILESISDGFFTLDQNLVVTYFNKAAEGLLGRKSTEVLGRNLFDAFPGAKGSIFEEKYILAVKEKRHLAFEAYFGVNPYEDWYEVRVYPHEDGISVYFQVTTERKRAQEKLRKSEETARALLNAPTESALLIGRRGTIRALNETAQQRLGRGMDDLVGVNAYDLLPPDLAKARKARIDEVLRSGDPVRFEDERQGRYLDNRIYPVFDAQGNVEQIAVFSTDITDRKRVEEALRRSEEQYRRIVNTAQEGIWVVDAEAKVDYVNEQLAEMLGCSVEEILGRHLFDFMDDLSPTALGESLKGHTWETTGKHDFRFRRKDGTALWGMVSSSPMFDDSGQFVGALGMIIDVTQRKRAGDELKKTSEAIKLFSYSVAHDLKNPAIGVYGLTKRLRKQYGDILDEEGKDYCNQILQTAEQIAELADNINVYISTREISLKIGTCELGEILQIVRDEISTQLDIRQVAWKQPEIVPEIRGDRLSILRILRNLADNALKYGGDELTEIKIGYEESDQFHIVSVSDDGVGVTGYDIEKLFSVFQRQETSRGVEGIGLGLAIVKELAEQHSGEVWVEPGPEKGATFHVSISKDL